MAFDLRSLPPDVLITREDFDLAIAQNNSPYLLKERRGVKVSDDFKESVDVQIGAK